MKNYEAESTEAGIYIETCKPGTATINSHLTKCMRCSEFMQLVHDYEYSNWSLMNFKSFST